MALDRTQPRARVTRSVQYGSVVLNGTTSNTATITSVDTSKSELGFLGFESDTNDIKTSPRITLTNATTVTATRNAGAGSITSVHFVVTEFY